MGMGPRRGLRLPRSRRSSGDWRTGVFPHCTMMACGDVRGRVTDGAGSSVAAEWPDPSQAAALEPTKLGSCRHCKWPSARREWATRGDERRNTAAHGHGISLGAIRMALVLGVDEAGSVFWRSRARRLVGSAARRLDGPSAHRPSEWQNGRGPGSEFAPKRAIGPRY